MSNGKKVSVRVQIGYLSALTEQYGAYTAKYSSSRMADKPALSDVYRRSAVKECTDRLPADTSQKHSNHRESGATSIASLPTVDGGIRTACVTAIAMDPSFQTRCLGSEMCGFCLCELSLKSPQKRNTKAKKQKTINSKEEVRAGVVSFKLHYICYQSWERENIIGATSAMTKLNGIYEYESEAVDEDEATCDVCSRGGGIMYYFDLGAGASKRAPPLEQGWLAHVPCLYWLEKSDLCQPIENVNDGSDETVMLTVRWLMDLMVSRIENAGVDGCCVQSWAPSDESDCGGLEAQPSFDSMLDRWKCALCASSIGLTFRCAAVGCCVRTHFLCASTAKWFVFGNGSSSDKATQGKALSFLCPVHGSDFNRK
jgi:hypothetical protein